MRGEIVTVLALLPILAVSAYVQTLTGFAFALLAMGCIGLTHLMPLQEAAIVIGMLVIANALQILRRGRSDVARGTLMVTTLASLPLVAVGVWLAGILTGEQARWLRLLLGLSIVVSGVQLVRRSTRRTRPSGTAATAAIGALSGLMGGLFSASGPPLAQHLYRQPLPLDTIRTTLVSAFAINAVARLALVSAQGQMTLHLVLIAALGLPVVMAATWLARRHPPPLSTQAIRLVVFALLVLSGSALVIPAIAGILAGRG